MTAKKSFKKVTCAVLAGVSALASAAMFSACTTSHPEVEMQIEFNDTTYTLEYKLYRKIAPSTVVHFLELCENKYFDGLCVHDFTGTSGRMYTGGYTFDETKEENNGLVEKEYFAAVKDLALTSTVWTTVDREESTKTVYGEFKNNGFEVESGALSQTYGSLTMYYTPKDTAQNVCVQRADGNGYNQKLYKYNSATSLFFISLSETTSSDNNYCTFATLEDDSKEKFNELKSAIDSYISDNYTEAKDFNPEITIKGIDSGDRYVGDQNESAKYKVPKEPIIIKSVSVKSY